MTKFQAEAFDEELDAIHNVGFGGERTFSSTLAFLLTDAVEFHYKRIQKGIAPTGRALRDIDLEGLPEAPDVAALLREVQHKAEIHKNLIEIYETLGLDEFIEVCKARNIDWKKVLSEDFTFQGATKLSWAEEARRWLDIQLMDHEPHTTASIREAAEEDGIVSGEEDWNKMRVIASREGLSSAAGHGKWRKL